MADGMGLYVPEGALLFRNAPGRTNEQLLNQVDKERTVVTFWLKLWRTITSEMSIIFKKS